MMDSTPTAELVETLKDQVQTVLPDDPIAEAGRKAMLPDFIEMIKHEAGSRTGEDIEDVHDMRVATRRMRSALRLLAAYYKPKTIRTLSRSMRKTARVLGTVRDLDVLIHDLQTYQATLNDDAKAALQGTIDLLDGERQFARQDLVRTLDKGDYRRFVQDFRAFLTQSGVGAKSHSEQGELTPSQVRHILPTLVYEHLGTVRAYDALIADADANTLHALRIEFKRLRYLVSLFSPILGSSIKDFITELKAIQDHLGRMNDLHVAQERLSELLPELDDSQKTSLRDYIAGLAEEETRLGSQVADVWRRFNSRSVQRQLATAIAAL
ncbi:MAG: CHAD domain-containing protein [bacterium]|nr:CHAD domain-containing protein [bacterium]